MGLFKKDINKEFVKHFEIDEENYRKTGSFLTKEQKNSVYELNDNQIFGLANRIFRSLPNYKAIKNFEYKCTESMSTIDGFNINKNDLLYFVVHFNIKLPEYVAKDVAELYIQLIDNEKIDVHKECWYNESLYASPYKNDYEVSNDIDYRIKAVGFASNPQLQTPVGMKYELTEKDLMDENGNFISTGNMKRKLNYAQTGEED